MKGMKRIFIPDIKSVGDTFFLIRVRKYVPVHNLVYFGVAAKMELIK